jgi:hypothetical protein
MNQYYISIGAQCTTATLFQELGVKKESLPFDWIFSTPEFVYAILKFLLIDNRDAVDIVDNEFFICDKKTYYNGVGQDINIIENGYVPDGATWYDALFNSKYNVSFPHNIISDRDKYIRRIERLKQIILNPNNFLNFVYVSYPSQYAEYSVNGVRQSDNLYYYIYKINDLIKSITNNYKILIFDISRHQAIVNPDTSHIFYFDMVQRNTWQELLPELNGIFNFLYTNNHMLK